MNGVTHQQYVRSVRKRVRETAARLLDKSVPITEGIRITYWLISAAEMEHEDPDRMAFVIAEGYTDEIPVGKERDQLSQEAIERIAPEIRDREEMAYDTVKEACRSLIARFDAEASEEEDAELTKFWSSRKPNTRSATVIAD